MAVSIGENLFFDLATLLEAGISPLQAASKLSVKGNQLQRWSKVIKDIEKGRTLSRSLFQAGLVDEFERETLVAAEHAGRLEVGLKKLATAQDLRDKNRGKVKSKLFYPFAVYFIATLVSTLLFSLRSDKISFIDIFMHLVLPVCFGLFFVRWLLDLFNLNAGQWLVKCWRWRQQGWYMRLFQQTVFGALLWQVESGVDMQSALKKIALILKHKAIRRELNQTALLCGKGYSLSQALAQVKLPVRYDLVGVIHSAESSGTLVSSLEHFLKSNAEQLQSDIDQWVEWLPRIIYTLSAALAIWAILGG